MKKIFLLGTIFLLFISCNSKENKNTIIELEEKLVEFESKYSELNIQNSKLLKENNDNKKQIAELELQINELKKINEELNTQLNKNNIDYIFDKEKYETYDLQYSLDFKDGGLNTKVYETPSTEKEIYVVQTNDIVDVYHIVFVKGTEQTFIYGKIKDNMLGFIKIGKNPYSSGKFSLIETIDVEQKQVSVLKLESTFLISEETIIKEFPSNNAKDLHKISHKEGGEYFKSIAITSDYKWVKMIVGEIEGWVPADSLSRDIGGPTIDTPEKYIYWDLIGSNLI